MGNPAEKFNPPSDDERHDRIMRPVEPTEDGPDGAFFTVLECREPDLSVLVKLIRNTELEYDDRSQALVLMTLRELGLTTEPEVQQRATELVVWSYLYAKEEGILHDPERQHEIRVMTGAYNNTPFLDTFQELIDFIPSEAPLIEEADTLARVIVANENRLI